MHILYITGIIMTACALKSQNAVCSFYRLHTNFQKHYPLPWKIPDEINKHSMLLKVYSLIYDHRSKSSIIDIRVRILNPKFQLIPILCQRVVHNNGITNAPLTSMLKILSDPIINQIGTSVQINKSLQLCFRISCFLSVSHQINTK